MRGRWALTFLCSLLVGAATAEDSPQRRFAIRAGQVLTMTGDPITDGVVLVDKGKIIAVGPAERVQIPKGTYLIKRDELWLTPGFIELHCHIGAGRGWGDLNDSVHQVNPELRNLDVFLPGNELLRNALQGGVTSALFIPGSGSNMSGFGTLIKTYGVNRNEVVLRFPGGLKIAQALNPERRGGDLGAGRMGMNLMIRKTLEEGRDYARTWKTHRKHGGPAPRRIPRLEYLRGIFERRYPIIVHTAAMQVQHSTTRILHDELGLDPILSHGTFDAFKDAPYVAKRGLHVNLGPRQIWFDRRRRAIYGVVERWTAGGVRNMSVCTDSPVLLQEDLIYQATIGAHFGGPSSRAFLEGLTIKAAKALYIDNRIGSIQAGRDADLVLWSGDPLDPRSRVRLVFVNGRRAYDLARDRGRY